MGEYEETSTHVSGDKWLNQYDSLKGELDNDSEFTFLKEHAHFWDSDALPESIDALKKEVLKAAADNVISFAGGILSRVYIHNPDEMGKKRAEFWLKHVPNVALNKKDYEDAVRATLRLMFPTIEKKVPSTQAIKSAISWWTSRGFFKPLS